MSFLFPQKLLLIVLFFLWYLAAFKAALGKEYELEINQYKPRIIIENENQSVSLVKPHSFIMHKERSGVESFLISTTDLKTGKNPVDVAAIAFLLYNYDSISKQLINSCACHLSDSADNATRDILSQSSVRVVLSAEIESRLAKCAQSLGYVAAPHTSDVEIALPNIAETCQKASTYAIIKEAKPELSNLDKGISKATWTIFIYAAADEGDSKNAEIRDSTVAMISSLESIRSLQPSSRVKVIVQHDDVGHDNNFRYEMLYRDHKSQPSSSRLRRRPRIAEPITEDAIKTITPGFQYGERDSGDPRTLKDFLRWGVHAYPAQHYILILSGHSWGSFGHMEDFFYQKNRRTRPQKQESASMFSNYELRRAMEETYAENRDYIPEGKFDLLLIDGCVSGQLEVALEVKDVFDYFAASSMETPHYSIPFDEILSSFVNRVHGVSPDASTSEQHLLLEENFLRQLSERYSRAHSPWGKFSKLEKQETPITLFALRSSELEKIVSPLRALTAALNQGSLTDLVYSRDLLKSLTDGDGYVDLLTYVSSLQRPTYAHTEITKQASELAKILRLEDALDSGPGAVHFMKSETVMGAWIHMIIDPRLPPLLSICNGIRQFSLSNAGKYNPIEALTNQTKNQQSLSIKDFICEPEVEGGHLDKEAVSTFSLSQFPMAIERMSNYSIQWTNNIPAYASLVPRDLVKNYSNNFLQYALRVPALSIWIDRKHLSGEGQEILISLAGMTHFRIDYLTGDPIGYILKKQGYEKLLHRYSGQCVDPSGRTLSSAQPGLYVTEMHSAGTHPKRGIGIFAISNPDLDPKDGRHRYMRGRVPIERAEACNRRKLTLESYFDALDGLGQVHATPITAADFYREHRIATTGWSDLIFGKTEHRSYPCVQVIP